MYMGKEVVDKKSTSFYRMKSLQGITDLKYIRMLFDIAWNGYLYKIYEDIF